MTNFPDKVYLVVGDDDCTPEENDWDEIDTHELSWSSSREYKGDVGYIREDLVIKAQIDILEEVIGKGDYRMGSTDQMAGAHYGELKKKLKELKNKKDKK